MKLFLLWTCMYGSLSTMLYAHQNSDKPVVISLGANCFPAEASRHFNIRDQAYPFDWLITPFEGLYAMLNNDFAEFLDEQHLAISSINTSAVVDTKFGFMFSHDFPVIVDQNMVYLDPHDDINYHYGTIAPSFKIKLPEVKSKYQRRIERFLKVVRSPAPIIFIRRNLTTPQEELRNQAIALRDLIEQRFPSIHFTLVYLNSHHDMHTDWVLPKIRNFYLPAEAFNFADALSWSNYYESWKAIFLRLNLIKATS